MATCTQLTAFEIPGDRLGRWSLLAEGAGVGKPIFATGIRNGQDAQRMAELWNADQGRETPLQLSVRGAAHRYWKQLDDEIKRAISARLGHDNWKPEHFEGGRLTKMVRPGHNDMYCLDGKPLLEVAPFRIRSDGSMNSDAERFE